MRTLSVSLSVSVSLAALCSSSYADDAAIYTAGVLPAHGEPAFASIATGWDGARRDPIFDLQGELAIAGPLQAIVRITGTKPGAGLGVQWLDEAHHGLAATAYLLAKAEGFTEPEGELEATVAFGRHVDRAYLTLALAYGQDPDAKERDGEVAFAANVPVGTWLVGVVARGRDALGSAGDKDGVMRDGNAGLSATYLAGHIGITATAGLAAVGVRDMPRAVGPRGASALGSTV